ncbi:MAG: Tol-Pal system beta propeller repeat protein TolB [Acidobacteria bacterium]|nr:Tol-Pal system beta propeller repeat protein TolB [Acidobacteriota bacterium]
MTNKKTLIGLLVFLAASGVFAQQEVVLKISEGMPMILLALPEFVVRSASPLALAAAQEIRQTLSDDVKYSRIFQLLPKDYYGYIRPLNPDKIFFKDWDSVQARLLVVGEVREDGGRVVFDGKIYDVKSERFIVGKRYQAEKNGLRLVAHKMADELLKLHGEKPIFTTKIAFVSNRDGNDEITMMDYDGASQTRVTFNKIKDYMPAWSPDQRTIAFTSYRGGTAGLYLRNIYEGKETPVSTKGTNYSAAFSPDGKKLAFCSTMTEEGNAEIYILDLESMKTKRLTFNSATETAPSWSPTGREIAFTTDRLGVGSPQIYIMDAEGSNVRKASFGGNYHDSPAWAPTSERIAFVSRVDNAFDIYILNLRTNQITKLTENNVRNESPSWSPDGRHVVFSSNLSGSIQLYTVDYDGANLRRLTDRGENKLPNWTN